MHNGSIRPYGSIFSEIKEHSYEKSGIPVHEALYPPLLQSQRSFDGQGHIVEKRTLAPLDISKSICAKCQISSFTPSYRTRKLIEHPTYLPRHIMLNMMY